MLMEPNKTSSEHVMDYITKDMVLFRLIRRAIEALQKKGSTPAGAVALFKAGA